MNLPILIIDDEVDVLDSYQMALKFRGYTNIICESSPEHVYELMQNINPAVVLLDLNMPRVCGEELIEYINNEYPDTVITVITGANDVETAVRCMKKGARDYIVKPVENTRLVSSVENAFNVHALKAEVSKLKESVIKVNLDVPANFSRFVTKSKAMLNIFKYMESIADSSMPVLITGESGTGKELIAKAVYNCGQYEGEFVAVNIAGLDESMFSDTLFGHTRGAFTGADAARKGLIGQASRGVLFLDEIGDLAPGSQVKLLRLLQEKEYYPQGADRPKKTDARIVVATHVDIADLRTNKNFRNDLYYRLLAHHIHLPPLRDRIEDISLLASRFLKDAATQMGRDACSLSEEAIRTLESWRFPGNVRELQAMVADAVSTCTGDVLGPESFINHIHKQAGSNWVNEAPPVYSSGRFSWQGAFPSIGEVSDFLMERALDMTGGNQTAAANLVGVNQSTLSRWAKTHGGNGRQNSI